MLTIVFMLMPFQPLILQVANATTRPMLHRVEYYVDMDKYYFPILIHGYFAAVICVTSIVATDAIFVIFVQHACGLFIITGWVTMSREEETQGTFLNFISLSLKLANRTSHTGGISDRRYQSPNYKRYGVSKYDTVRSRS